MQCRLRHFCCYKCLCLILAVKSVNVCVPTLKLYFGRQVHVAAAAAAVAVTGVVAMQSDLCVAVVEDEKKSSEKKQSVDKELMYTADRALLLACVYFDQSHAGYLLDKDAEDIVHATGLQLSRAQVSLPHCLSVCSFCQPAVNSLYHTRYAVSLCVLCPQRA